MAQRPLSRTTGSLVATLHYCASQLVLTIHHQLNHQKWPCRYCIWYFIAATNGSSLIARLEIAPSIASALPLNRLLALLDRG